MLQKGTRPYKRLTQEERNEALQMYKDGATQRELADMFDVSQSTISHIIKEANYDRVHVGGKISRTIPVAPNFDAQDAPIAPKPIASLAIQERTIILRGSGTLLRYTLNTNASSLFLSNDEGSLEIGIDKIDALIEELKQLNDWK